jgi:DNA-binding transcriptional LysR family regulator
LSALKKRSTSSSVETIASAAQAGEGLATLTSTSRLPTRTQPREWLPAISGSPSKLVPRSRSGSKMRRFSSAPIVRPLAFSMISPTST